MSKWTNQAETDMVFKAFERSEASGINEVKEYKFPAGKTCFVPDMYDALIPSHAPALTRFEEPSKAVEAPAQKK